MRQLTPDVSAALHRLRSNNDFAVVQQYLFSCECDENVAAQECDAGNHGALASHTGRAKLLKDIRRRFSPLTLFKPTFGE